VASFDIFRFSSSQKLSLPMVVESVGKAAMPAAAVRSLTSRVSRRFAEGLKQVAAMSDNWSVQLDIIGQVSLL